MVATVETLVCAKCGAVEPPDTRFCSKCGALLSWAPATAPAAKRHAPIDATSVAHGALQAEIDRYVRQGYRVVSQTDTAAQLVKPKTFSVFWAVVGFLVLYVLYYLSKRDRVVYLTVDADGKVVATKR